MKTSKMKKVLIAMDYNPSAQKVAESGYALAKKIGAGVVLLHVVSEPNPIYSATLDYDPIMGYNGYLYTGPRQLNSTSEIKKSFLQFLEKSAIHLGDKTIKTVVKTGNIAETIIKAAVELHADIIVIGTHSKRSLEEILMGGVTEKVLHHSPVPVFVVPTKLEKKDTFAA